MIPPDEIERCYRILELQPGASSSALKKAYRDLVKVWHPDRFSGDPSLQEKASEKLKQINQAFEILSRLDGDSASTAGTSARKDADTQTNPEIGKEPSARVVRFLDKPTGRFRFSVKEITVTGFDGRWRSENNSEYVSRLVDADANFEQARNGSMSFCSKPADGRRGIHSDYASLLGPECEIYGSSNEYLFEDGSKIIREQIRIDTLFRNPVAKEKWKATHATSADAGRSSRSGCFGVLALVLGLLVWSLLAVIFAIR